MTSNRLRSACIAAPVLTAIAVGTGAASSYAPGFGPCIITAAVRDAQGRPVAGAVVDASGPTERSATTSASGIVTFNAVPAGRYVIRARSASERSTFESVSVTTAPGAPNANRAIQFIALQLEPDGAVGSQTPQKTLVIPLPLAEAAPAFALDAGAHVDLSGLGTAGGLRVDGGDSRGLRERLDGIPLPDALRGSLVLFGAPALGDTIALAGGTGTLGARPAAGTGGVADLATLPLGSSSRAVGAAGSSDAGFAASLAADQTAGPFAAGLRLGTAAGDVRDRALRARIKLSPSTEIDGEAYRLDDGDGLTAGPYAVTVRSASASTSLGDARVALAAYDSGFDLGAAANDASHGIALRYDGTVGSSGLDVSYTRDGEFARYGNGSAASSTESHLGLRSVYDLSSNVRAEVDSDYAHGTLIGNRENVATTIGFTISPTFLLKFSAGSGAAPAPLDLVAERAIVNLRTPETAFEDAVSLEHTAGSSAFDVSGFETREHDRFAAFSDARATGLSLQYASAPPVGLGFVLSSAVSRVAVFGTATPDRDPSTTDLAALLGLSNPDDALAALRGRAALSFRTRAGAGAELGATYFDAPNALAPTALLLGDLSIHIPLARGNAPLAVRFSAHDVLGGSLGEMTAQTREASSHARRDFELTLERPAVP